jgi:hypothetical protein
MMRIFDALHTHLFDVALLRNQLPATAVERAVNGAWLGTAEFHLSFLLSGTKSRKGFPNEVWPYS